jgi:superfamily II DNA or RNA helicase
LKLRDYQEELVNGIKQSMIAGNHSIIVQSPPRSGKTVVMAHIAKGATDKNNKVLFFSHRKEINEQVYKTFENNEVNMNLVTIGGVQSLVRKLDKLDEPTIILIDEAHHSKATSYKKIIDYFPNAYKLLFTGTPIRLDGSGFDDIAEAIVLGKSVKWLQEHGRIAPFKYYAPLMINESALKKRAGEFTKGSVDETMKTVIYGDVIKHYEKLAKGKQAIVYTHSVEASENVSKAFNEAGYNSIAVSGKTPREARETAMRAFRNGDLKIMVNCELFTEGIDLPNVDVCIMLRPTQSLSLYLQFAMRALNPREGKTAIIIDHVGNVERFGLPNQDREWSLQGIVKKKQTAKIGEPTVRVCEKCFATFWSSERTCPDCGFTNPPTAKEIEIMREAELTEINEQKQQKIKKRVETYITADMCRNMDELKEYRDQHGYKNGWGWDMAKKIGILR